MNYELLNLFGLQNGIPVSTVLRTTPCVFDNLREVKRIFYCNVNVNTTFSSKDKSVKQGKERIPFRDKAAICLFCTFYYLYSRQDKKITGEK